MFRFTAVGALIRVSAHVVQRRHPAFVSVICGERVIRLLGRHGIGLGLVLLVAEGAFFGRKAAKGFDHAVTVF